MPRRLPSQRVVWWHRVTFWTLPVLQGLVGPRNHWTWWRKIAQLGDYEGTRLVKDFLATSLIVCFVTHAPRIAAYHQRWRIEEASFQDSKFLRSLARKGGLVVPSSNQRRDSWSVPRMFKRLAPTSNRPQTKSSGNFSHVGLFHIQKSIGRSLVDANLLTWSLCPTHCAAEMFLSVGDLNQRVIRGCWIMRQLLSALRS